MIPDSSARPLALIGFAAALGLVAHRWWRSRRARAPAATRSDARTSRDSAPRRAVHVTAALPRAHQRTEVPWGVEQPL